MLESINSFIKKVLIMSFLVAAVSITLAVLQKKETGDNGASISKFIADLPEEVRDDNPTQVVVNIGKKVDQLKALQGKSEGFDIDIEQLQQTIDNNKARIGELHSELNEKNLKIDSFQTQINQKEEEIKKLKGQISEGDSSLLSIISKLNRDMVIHFGRSINPMYPYPISEKKREANKKIQTILAELGYYEGILDGDGESTRKALSAYKKAKGFTKNRLHVLTASTTNKMIIDYVLNSE